MSPAVVEALDLVPPPAFRVLAFGPSQDHDLLPQIHQNTISKLILFQKAFWKGVT